jgi:DNA modification methylase
VSSSWLAGQIEQWPVGKLVPYARNARTHSPAQIAQIAASIAEFGFTNPILVGSDGGIVAGHGRLAGAMALGLTTVPVIVLGHLNPAQRRALVIADNRLALDAGWDEEMLARELTALQEDDGFDLSLLGFSDQELAELLAGIEGTSDGLTDEDAVPDLQEKPVTVLGDVWLLDDHRLMCDDSTNIDAVKKLMDGQQADILITDPPYNVAYGGAGGNAANKNKVDGGQRNTQTILNDDMSDDAFRQFLKDAFTTATTVMKPGAVFYIWHSDSEGYNFRGACRDAGLTVRQCLIWKKSQLVMGRQDYQWKHEPCLYGWKDGAGHLWAADRKQTTILEFDKPSINDIHPTMKPVALFEYQMLNNTKGADVVLDLFGGSGTTALVAEKHGRHARLMELDPKYCDVICRRWQDFTGHQAIRESDGMAFDQAASSSSTISQ